MSKDEMKNRISMALKDPTLQQGFEIICKELEAEKKLNTEIKARFVKCNTCTDEMKSKCLMFSENLCQGERCEELVDLMSLISKSELEKENAELKKINADGLSELNHINGDLIIENEKLKKENAELKQRIEWLDMAIDSDIPIADKLAELEKENAELKKLFAGCDTCKRTCDIGNCCKFGNAYLPDVEKVLNKQKQLTKAKEIIKDLCGMVKELNNPNVQLTNIDYSLSEAEQFLGEVNNALS